MSQHTVKALLAANTVSLRHFRDALALSFQLAGRNLASKLAVQQATVLLEEHEELAALVETMELPALENGVLLPSAMEQIFEVEGGIGERLQAFNKYSAELKEQTRAACNEIERNETRPDRDAALTAAIMVVAVRMSVVQGINEMAAGFASLAEGSCGAMIGRLMERIGEYVEANPPPAPQPEPVPAVQPSETSSEGLADAGTISVLVAVPAATDGEIQPPAELGPGQV